MEKKNFTGIREMRKPFCPRPAERPPKYEIEVGGDGGGVTLEVKKPKVTHQHIALSTSVSVDSTLICKRYLSVLFVHTKAFDFATIFGCMQHIVHVKGGTKKAI